MRGVLTEEEWSDGWQKDYEEQTSSWPWGIVISSLQIGNYRMVQFRDFRLPVELLSPILSYVLKPNHLFNICRVSRHFYDAAVPKLYFKVTIFAWHKDAKTRASAER